MSVQARTVLWLMREYRLVTPPSGSASSATVRPGTRRPAAPGAHIPSRSRASLALLRRLCAQPGAGWPPLRAGGRGAGLGVGAARDRGEHDSDDPPAEILGLFAAFALSDGGSDYLGKGEIEGIRRRGKGGRGC